MFENHPTVRNKRSADVGGTYFKAWSSWRWKNGKRFVFSKRSIFSTVIKRPLAAGT